jgi:hypothetical protein
MKIGVSIGNFYYWDKQFDIKSKLKYVELLKKVDLEVIELHFSKQEILNKDYEKFLKKLKKKWIITVHLPGKINNKKIVKNLKDMQKLLKVKHFIIHADDYSKTKRLFKESKINLIVENCDREKKNYQDLKSVIKLGKPLCLDIDHFEESFPGKLSTKLPDIKKKVVEVHISALNNKLYDYKHIGKARHYLVYGSDYTLPKNIPKKAIWIIEGVIPKGRLDLLRKEVKLLRNI